MNNVIYDYIFKYAKLCGSTVTKFDGEKRYFSTGNINTNDFEIVSFENKPSRANLIAKENDILIAKMKNTNKTTLISKDMQNDIYSTGFMCLESYMMDNKYLYYLLQSPEFIENKDLNSYGTTQKAINDDRFKTIKVHFVSDLIMQKKISNYLDRKVKSLDKIIQSHKQEVEKLEELKRSEIISLSFYGLNKDLNKKDSNIEYIGRIPINWEVRNLFEVIHENKTKNKGMINNNLLSLSYGKIVNKDIESNEGLLPESFESYQIVKPGNIILRLTDLQNDKKSLRVGHVYEEGIITSAYVGLVIDSNEICSEYLYYLLHSYDLCKVFYNMGSGVRQSLNYGELRRLKIIIPPKSDQQKIIDILNKKQEKIDRLIKVKEDIISRLEEYKKALIYEAVIGNVEV